MTTTMHKQLTLALLIVLTAATGHAASFTYSGTFSQDDDIVLFLLELNTPGQLSAHTTSFATGGFAPVLSLFEYDNPQLLLALDYGGLSGPCPPDPTLGFCWDASVTGSFQPGTYLLALTQDNNLPLGPTYSDGFQQQGQGNFTSAFFPDGPRSFRLLTGAARTGDWSVVIEADAAAVVPEPGSIILTLGSLLAFAIVRRGAKIRAS